MPDQIEGVEVSVRVSLPKELVRAYKEDPTLHLADLTDEELVTALAEGILDRYFNTEYFDLSKI